MADNKGSNNDRKTIEHYGLKRVPENLGPSDAEFAEKYIGPLTDDWEAYMVKSPRSSSSSGSDPEEWDNLHSYVLSLSQQAYMISFVALTRGEHLGAERLTEMRFHEMIIDNIRAAAATAAAEAVPNEAGGSNDANSTTGRTRLPNIRWIGARMIIHEGAADSIRAVFEQAGTDVLDRGTVEVTPADGARFSACFDGNPLARSVRSLTQHHAAEMGGAFIKRFIFIAEGNEFGQPRLHMLVELGWPTAAADLKPRPAPIPLFSCGGVIKMT
ncbi:hypothetical protein SLS62_003392 [Diatrype stigma]|uniref:Uncharacterized protein n=1 Tax=Diatrype stigma TaxID=117547 RepID=A0AAN9YUB5_9PEZI